MGLRKLFKRLALKGMDTTDLNRECAAAAAYYLESPGLRGMPVAERQAALNYVAVGFGMGIRWHEKKLGAKGGRRY